MADLIAQGDAAQQRWRRALPDGVEVVLGRTAGGWAVPWDTHVSRKHVSLRYDKGQLHVTRFPDTRNPVYFRGKAAERFSLRAGEHFVIGQTRFTLADQRVNLTVDAPQPIQQQSFDPEALRQLRFRNPDHRIEVLSRLPEALSATNGQTDLCVAVASMLLAGMPRADAVAVVSAEGDESGRASIRVIHWDQRLVGTKDFEPSQRLILEALRSQESVLHVWSGGLAAAQPFTARGDVDWAFCTPLAGSVYRSWGLYVAGRFRVDPSSGAGSADATDPSEDVKFTELVAATMTSLGQMRRLERQQASFRQFFSPVLLERLSVEDPDVVLAPRETEVSVLFCDLRGFSLQSEQHADKLLETAQPREQGPGRDDPSHPRRRRRGRRFSRRRGDGILGLAARAG